MSSALIRMLRFVGLLLLNVIVAVIGTAIMTTALSKVFPSHTIGAVLWKEIALSILCASLIGYGMWRTWRSEAAKWAWVIPSLWFALGFLAISGHGIWGPLSVNANNIGAAEMRSFFIFTVPLIRAVAYSVAAYLSPLYYSRTQTPA